MAHHTSAADPRARVAVHRDLGPSGAGAPPDAAEREIATTLESITDAFVAVDADWRCTYINDRALQRMQHRKVRPVAREEMLGRSLWEMFPDLVGTEIHRRCHQAMRERRPVQFETCFDAMGRWMEAHAYPSGDGLAIHFRDITDRKRDEAERERRAHQQAFVAELGLRALESDDLQALMGHTVTVVARTLDVDVVSIGQLLPGGAELLLRAAHGWTPGQVGHATAPAGRGSLVGYTLLSGGPVISDDLMADERFAVSTALAATQLVSGVSVIIPGRGEPFGGLGALAREPRAFHADDVNFLQAVANVLAAAVQRTADEQRLTDVRDAERRRIARNLHDEALQDLNHALALAGGRRPGASEAAASDPLTPLAPALRRVGDQLRGAIYDLRLGGHDARPFGELLEALVGVHRAMAEDCEIELTVAEGVPAGPLGATGTEVLRILGEALTNARRHSRARRVEVRASGSAGWLSAEVRDDGRGFDAPAVPPDAGGHGISGMRERAALVHGRLDIRGAPGGGTVVRVDVPLSRDGDEPVEPLRVLLVEDHVAVREAIAAAFERDAGFRIAGQAASLTEARKRLADVDLLVVDLGLPDGYGADLIPELRRLNPRAQALVLTATVDRADVARAVERGAAGVLNKAARLDEVVDALRRLRAGETLLPMDEIVELLRHAGRIRESERADRDALAQLTPREREILQALADGLDARQIADHLYISIRTVRNHMTNILAKLDVHSQLQALVFALRYDAVEIR